MGIIDSELDRERKRVASLEDELALYRTGYQGSCYACEPVAKTNQRLREENFSLAANQCHHGYGDAHGHHRCRYQDQLAAVMAENERLREQKEEPRQINWAQVASHVPARVWADTSDRRPVRLLTDFRADSAWPYRTDAGGWKHADLLTNLWVPHISDECPLPAGVEVEVVLRDGSKIGVKGAETFCWEITEEEDDIMRFRVTGLASGWKW